MHTNFGSRFLKKYDTFILYISLVADNADGIVQIQHSTTVHTVSRERVDSTVGLDDDADVLHGSCGVGIVGERRGGVETVIQM